jgi:hypothetical protein
MFRNYFISVVIGLAFITGYNVWLAQRDQKLFDAYGQAHPLCTEYTFQKECNDQ